MRGQRTIDGRVLDLVERYVGAGAASDAAGRAKKIRAQGGFARVIRYGVFDVAVFALGGQPWW
jgi:hypothetical protein